MAAKTLNTRQMDMAFLFWMAFEIFSETGDVGAFADAQKLFGAMHGRGASRTATRASLVGAGVLEMQPGGVWYVRVSKISA